MEFARLTPHLAAGCLLALALATGCATPPGPRGADRLPAELNGLRLGPVSTADPESVAVLITGLGLEAAWTATYTGDNSEVRVNLYQMRSQTAAFELSQKWRLEEGSTALYSGPFFVVLTSETSQDRLLGLAGTLKSAFDSARP